MQETKEEEAKRQSEKDPGNPHLKTENVLSKTKTDFGEETNVESQEKQRRPKKRLKIKKS